MNVDTKMKIVAYVIGTWLLVLIIGVMIAAFHVGNIRHQRVLDCHAIGGHYWDERERCVWYSPPPAR